MCGIAAAISVTGRSTGRLDVTKMLATMTTRGDCLSEIAELGPVSLGCNRLAIVDPENGRQPLFSEDRNVAVVFNGEIYNHKLLMSELEIAGHKFRTMCDTEVLVHGYEEWGIGILERLKGMYAFVLVDHKKSKVLASRDPFGIKPLYFVQTRNGRFFASEMKALHSVAKGTIQLVPPGGHVVNKRISQRLRLPQPNITDVSADDAKRKLRELLQQSVGAMLKTDMPVAVLCSGGLDSTAILYEAKQTSANITVYAVGVSEDAPDVRFASLAAKFMDVPFRPVIVSKETLLHSVPKVVEAIESFEPNHIRGGTLSYALGEAMHRDGIKIALCGEGADELFAGYPEFQDQMEAVDSAVSIQEKVIKFTHELHKTQLQRVDRTNMAWTVEVRVPFLDIDFATFALSIPSSLKLKRSRDGAPIAKWILREAYRGLLPNEIVDRPKMVLTEGAGVGDNSPRGQFFEHASGQLSDGEFRMLQSKNPDFHLRNKEEAYYFLLFHSHFGELRLAMDRPEVNTHPTRG